MSTTYLLKWTFLGIVSLFIIAYGGFKVETTVISCILCGIGGALNGFCCGKLMKWI